MFIASSFAKDDLYVAGRLFVRITPQQNRGGSHVEKIIAEIPIGARLNAVSAQAGDKKHTMVDLYCR
jgi:hypothetical protein